MIPGFDLKSTQFRHEREETWLELERLVDRVETGGFQRLTSKELNRLPSLYRNAVSSLSVARAISLDRNLLDYLENLTVRAYIAVYSTKRSVASAVVGFLAETFPRSVRRFWPHLAVSLGILLLGTLTGFLMTAADPERYYSLVPPQLAQDRSPASTTESLREVLYYVPPEDEEQGEVALDVFASFLFTHNAKVGILCFALGFAAGAPTVLLLFQNGLLLGALAALYQSRGLGSDFWAWVLPHGVTELGAVCLCGAAGLALGMAVVFPGRHRRLDNLALRGREVAMMVIGTLMLFFVAALIEGFFRQLVHDTTVRWSLAAITLVFWSVYFVHVGNRDERRADR